MNFLENLALVGTAATVLGVFLTGYAIVNNKTLKRESRLTREAIERVIKEESRLTREAMAEESKLTREMIKETTKYLGDLIAAKGSTR